MSPEFWTLLGVIVLQLANMYNNYRNNKAQAPLIEAQAAGGMSEGWVKLSQEYARQIENMKGLEVENASLRPLVLKLALQGEELKQHIEDKEDWKKYATTLVRQIEGLGQIPIPFKRYPSSSGDTDKMKPITNPKVKAAKAVQEDEQQ
jgi:hypothetical protein